MKRRLGLTFLALLVSASLAILKPIADQPPVDREKSRQELETMKGILRTSISYAMRTQNSAAEEDNAEVRFYGMRGSRVDAFYLYGQGAVFVIPVGSFGRGLHSEISAFVSAAIPDPEQIGLIAEEAARAAGEVAETLSPDTERQRERAERQRERTEEQRERLRRQLESQRQSLEERRAAAAKRREEMNKRREELARNVDLLAGSLRDTLASYGDSLTILRPEESITLVLTTESGFGPWGDSPASDTRVLSVRKALVTDLKAGKVTRDEFNRRMVDYSY
jgi:hypothetical protein